MLSVKEYKGVVVDNVDPDGKSRLKVFLLGWHDFTGMKTKVKDLKWVFCKSSSTNISNIPKVGQIVDVTYNGDFDPLSQGYWTPSSHYTKNDSALKSILPFLVYDTESKQFVTNFNEGYDNTKELEELNSKKSEYESQLEELKNQLTSINDEAQNVNDPITIEASKSELDRLKLELKRKEVVEEQTILRYESSLVSGNRAAAVLWNSENAKTTPYGKIPSGEDQVFATLEEYQNFYNADDQSRYDAELEDVRNQIGQIIQQSAALTQEIRNNSTKSINLNDASKNIQSEIETLSLQIEDVNSKIKNLESSAPSGDAASKANVKVEEVSNQQNIETEYDEKTGILYGNIDGKRLVIGNWTGLNFYTPGFFGQTGVPIYQRMSSILTDNIPITEKSYLTPVDEFAKERGDTTVNHPSKNPVIKKADNDKTWNCDISYETRLKILTKRKDLMSALQWVRDKISALLTDASGSSTGRWIKATATLLTNILKGIQKFLKFINDVVLEIISITAQIRQLITWILSLPARILALLQDCITHFFNSVSSAFSESLGSTGLDGEKIAFSEVTELVGQAQSTFNTALETVELTKIAYIEIKTVEATFEKV
jgi:peptidoglycan hydrolase CwlO-like protein